MTDQTNADVSAKSSLPVGKILASARSEQGMTTDMVAARLCLTEGYIKALESGNYSVLPGDTFIRGYLRNYADIVGLNAEELVRLYMEQQNLANISEQEKKAARAERSKSNKTMAAMAAVALLIVVAVVLSLNMGEEPTLETGLPETDPSETIESSVESEIEMTIQTVSESDVENSGTEPVASGAAESVEVSDAETTLDEKVEESTLEPAIEVAEELESVIEAPTTEKLEFTFLGECWYQVIDATGAKLAERTKSEGDASVVEGVPPFTVTLGDSTVVELLHEGEVVDLSAFHARKSARLKVGQ